MSEPTKLPNNILTDIYGTRGPDAAKFGVGARDHAQIVDATRKQHEQKPGDYMERAEKGTKQ